MVRFLPSHTKDILLMVRVYCLVRVLHLIIFYKIIVDSLADELNAQHWRVLFQMP